LRDAAAGERVLDLRGRCGLVRPAVRAIHARPRPRTRAVREQTAAGGRRGERREDRCIRNKRPFLTLVEEIAPAAGRRREARRTAVGKLDPNVTSFVA
jgi:hypothetical protein